MAETTVTIRIIATESIVVSPDFPSEIQMAVGSTYNIGQFFSHSSPLHYSLVEPSTLISVADDGIITALAVGDGTSQLRVFT